MIGLRGEGEAGVAGGGFESLYARRVMATRGAARRDLSAARSRPGVISLAGGHPDVSIFEEETLVRAVFAVVHDSAAALQYGPSSGLEATKKVVAEVMAAEGMPARCENVLVTNGAQQGLELAAKVFLEEGDAVLAEAPTYFGALNAFAAYRARVLPVPVDEGGMRMLGAPGRVVYLGTFSKIFAPGVRLGWMHAHPEVLEKARLAKKGADLGPSGLSQVLTTAYFKSGEWAGYLRRMVRGYRGRRDAMLDALAEFMPEGVAWTRPEGGFFVWVRLPGGVDAGEMAAEAFSRGVAYVPGEDFYGLGWEEADHLRLSYSFAEPPRIRQGMKILAEVVGERLGRGPERQPAGVPEGLRAGA